MTLSKGGRFMQLMSAVDTPVGPAPEGPPFDVNFSFYSGSKILYTWQNFNPTYYTQISLDGGTTINRTVAPTETMFASGNQTVNADFAVRHANGGLYSAWVLVNL